MDDLRKLGDVATRLIFENERVKVWEMLLEPGERSDFHEHTMDHLLYILEGDSIAVELETGESMDVPVEPDQCVYLEKGGREVAVNNGTRRFRELLIELKDG